ncbi:MAG: hypothetical protein H0U03_10005 [Actinobacteria bacterium]|nr:hypothetical protein [Actinomycetota bacterium]
MKLLIFTVNVAFDFVTAPAFGVTKRTEDAAEDEPSATAEPATSVAAASAATDE